MAFEGSLSFKCLPSSSSSCRHASTQLSVFLILLLALFHLNLVTSQTARVIKIGAIFEGTSSDLESVFRQTIDMVNMDKTRLPGTRLEAVVARINHRDSFHAAKVACQLIDSGVWALFGPQSPSVGWLIRSIADNLHIPDFQFNWDFRSFHRHKIYPSNMTINLHPEPSSLSQAFADLVESRNWKSFALIYEQDDDLIKAKALLKLSSMKIQIKQLPPSSQGYRKMFKDVKNSTEVNIVLSVGSDKVNESLSAAREIGLMTDYNNYLIGTIDVKQLDLSHFAEVNITGLSLHSQSLGRAMKVEEAFLSDAVYLFVKALSDLEETQSVTAPSLTCESRTPWAYGSILMNIMKVVNVRALTGSLKFDSYGRRSDFDLDVLELKKSGFRRVGTWNMKTKINITRNLTEVDADEKEWLRNKTLRVTAPTNAEPYIKFKSDHQNRTGNDRFEGYCIDLLDEIAAIHKFNYTILPVANNIYGSAPKDGKSEWNGMIRELIDHKADIGICDLTINSDRQTAVDFTLPFMHLGISILYKKPDESPPDLFSFMKPFSIEVWFYVATAYMGVTLLMYVLSRLSPYEWVSGHPCDDNPEELENQFSLGNSMWFTLGCIMQQGSDLAPRALSTRTLASVWAFFTLIIISSYTANLAAFLTVSRLASPIENVEDLARQTTIQYGCKEDGSTYLFFKQSNHSTYNRMFSAMENSHPSVFVSSNSEGIDRVKKGNYAYLAESTTIEFEVQRNCDLQQIGGLLDQKGYGIATPPDSPYRAPLTDALLNLQESGRLAELRKRWWEDQFVEQGITCPATKAADMKLDVGNVGGVFVVLVVGVATGVLIGMVEFVWKTKKVSRHERDHAAVMMWREFIRICSGGGGHRVTEQSISSSASKRSVSETVAAPHHASNTNTANGRRSETASRHNQINEVNVRIAVNSSIPLIKKKTSHVYFLPPDPSTDIDLPSPQALFTSPSPPALLLPNGMNHMNHFACQQIPNGYFISSTSIPLNHMPNGFFVPTSSDQSTDGFFVSPIQTISSQEAPFVLPNCETMTIEQETSFFLPSSMDPQTAVIEGQEYLLPSHPSQHPVTLFRETSC